MKDKKSFAFVDEFLSSGRWTVVVAGWGLGIFETKESAEHCARDINQAHADGIKEAETCRESGGTDSVCLKGHEDSMKEVRERERKAVAERDARIKELEKWRRAAILLGERIGTVGPNGYYSFTADQFFEWVKGLPTEPKP